MKNKSNKGLIIHFLISLVLSYLILILWVKKHEFDLEFKDKKTTIGFVTRTENNLEVEELYDGRKAETQNVMSIEYIYTVNQKEYIFGDFDFNNDTIISKQIKIEYLIDKPSISRIYSINNFKYNFFVRHLLEAVALSIFLMFIFFEIEKIITKNLKNR